MHRETFYLDTEVQPSWQMVSPEKITSYEQQRLLLNTLIEQIFAEVVGAPPLEATPLEYARQVFEGIPEEEFKKLLELHPEKILNIYQNEIDKRAEKASQQLWKRATDGYTKPAMAVFEYVGRKISIDTAGSVMDILETIPREEQLAFLLSLQEKWEDTPNTFTRKREIQMMIVERLVNVVAQRTLTPQELKEFYFRKQPHWYLIPRSEERSKTTPQKELNPELLTEPLMTFFDTLQVSIGSLKPHSELANIYSEAILNNTSDVAAGRDLAFLEAKISALPLYRPGSAKEAKAVEAAFNQENSTMHDNNRNVNRLHTKEAQLNDKIQAMIRENEMVIRDAWRHLTALQQVEIARFCTLYMKEENYTVPEKALLRIALHQALSILIETNPQEKN